MNRNHSLAALALGLSLVATGIAHAGAPQPETRQGDFAHVCSRGPNRGDACTVANQDVDCAGAACVVQTVGPTARGTLTLIAHDSVTDWNNGGAPNRALTVLLEVKAPSGPQLLSATYQNVPDPTLPPTAPSNVVSIDLDEENLANVADVVGDLLFVQPEAALAAELQELFETTGTPVLVDASEGSVRSADHTADPLATVVRFKVKIRFLNPEL